MGLLPALAAAMPPSVSASGAFGASFTGALSAYEPPASMLAMFCLYCAAAAGSFLSR